MNEDLKKRLLHGIDTPDVISTDEPKQEPEPEPKAPPPEPKPKPAPTQGPAQVDTSQHSKRLMTVTVHVKLWEGKRTDKTASQEVIENKKANHRSGRFIKNLVDHNKYIKPLEQIRTRSKALLYKYAMNWSYGVRVLTVDAYPTLKEEIDKLRVEYKKAVTNFIDNQYEVAKEEAKKELEGLGNLFDEHDYPNAAELRDKFEIQFYVTPFPTEVSLDLPESMKNEIKADMEKAITDRTRAAVTELVDRLDKALSDFGTRVQKDPKKWRDTTVTNLREILDLAPMLNVTGDTKIAEAIQVARMRLSFLDNLADTEVRNQSEAKRMKMAQDAIVTANTIKKILLS